MWSRLHSFHDFVERKMLSSSRDTEPLCKLNKNWMVIWFRLFKPSCKHDKRMSFIGKLQLHLFVEKFGFTYLYFLNKQFLYLNASIWFTLFFYFIKWAQNLIKNEVIMDNVSAYSHIVSVKLKKMNNRWMLTLFLLQRE